MSWVIAGLFVGILCSIIYIISLTTNVSREWLVQNIFKDSVYGDILNYFIDKENYHLEEEELFLGLFTLLISTVGILILIIALLTFFGYISLFIFILFIFAFFISYVIKKKEKQHG